MPKFKLGILIGLIIVIPAIPFIFIYPNGYNKTTLPTSIKYFVDIFTFVSIFSLGLYVFIKTGFPLIRYIWIIIHVLSFFFITAIALYIKLQTHWDAIYYNMMMAVFAMIASPVPFIILYLVNNVIWKTIKKVDPTH